MAEEIKNEDLAQNAEETLSPVEEDVKDKDIEEKEEKEQGSSVESEEYDMEQKTLPHADIEERLNPEDAVKIHYTFKGDDVREGLKVFQRYTIYKRNIIYSLILAVVTAVYIGSYINDPSSSFAMFMSVLCIAILGLLWFLPNKHIKSTANAIEELDMEYDMEIYPDCVRIIEEKGKFILVYGEEISLVLETDNLFVLCIGKQRAFILPKRYLEEENAAKIKAIFKEAMKENYKEHLN